MTELPLTEAHYANLARFWQGVDRTLFALQTVRWVYDPACAECHGTGLAAEYDWITGRGWRCACAQEATP